MGSLYVLLRNHQGVPSDVTHDFWAALPEFIAFPVHPPQPFCGRVTSMIQFGARRGSAVERKLFQSDRLWGEKSFVPSGQLFLSMLRRVSKQSVHFTTGPGEKGPLRVNRSHLQDTGLPALGTVGIAIRPVHSLASSLPLAKAGSFANCAFLYSGVIGYSFGTEHTTCGISAGYLMFKWVVEWVCSLHLVISAVSTLP